MATSRRRERTLKWNEGGILLMYTYICLESIYISECNNTKEVPLCVATGKMDRLKWYLAVTITLQHIDK
jgi:hypothetical protein